MAIDDRWKYNNMKVIFLTSEELSVAVIPELGGCMMSLKHLPSNTEMLASIREPRQIETYREGAPTDNLLDLTLIGGWYEVVPNAGYRSSYEGAEFGLHDETAYLSWKAEYDEDRDPDSILLMVRLNKFPLRLIRRMSLSGNRLVFDEKLINESHSKLPVGWLHHPMFGEEFIGEDTVLELPESEFEVDGYLPNSNNSLVPGLRGKWPFATDVKGRKTDLSRFPARGKMNSDDLVYVPKVSDGWFRLTNRRKKLAFSAKWDSTLFGSLWIWRPFGGGATYPWFGRIYGTAVEISTAWPATGLSEQVKLNNVRYIEPDEVISTKLEFTVDSVD